MKRQRSRGRSNKPGMQNPNRAYESAGPDIKVRGSAQTIFEKYQQLGRDCMASGDRILAENYFQHAEHYLRLIKAIQPNFVPRSEFAISGIPSDNDDENEETENNENEGEGADDNQNEDGEERPQREYRERNYDNNRFNNRRNNNNNNNRNRDRNDRNDRNDRDRYRPERNYQENPENSEPNTERTEVISEVSAAPSAEVQNDAPRSRGPRLRGLRVPRKPRERNDVEKQEGFGDEMPAFLQTPVVPADSE